MNKLILILLSFLIVSCAVQPIPSDQFFLLENQQTKINSFPLNQSIKLNKIKANGVFNSQEILFYQDGSIQKYNYFLWVDRPSNLIEQILFEKLQASIGSNIFNYDDRRITDLILDIELMELYHNQEGPQSKVVLKATLTNNKTKNKVISKTFEEVYASSIDINNFTDNTNQAINKILQQIIEDIAKTI